MTVTATQTQTKLPPTDTGRCGEYAGYQRHQKRGETPCEACLKSKRDYESANGAARRAARRRDTPVDKRGAHPLSERSVFGRFAGRQVMHPARLVDGQCVECFGWPCDPRHPVTERAVA